MLYTYPLMKRRFHAQCSSTLLTPTHRSNIERNLSARSPAAPARAPGCEGVIVFPVSVVWWLESPPSVVFSHGFVLAGGQTETDLRGV